ncbi:MAG TPA: hypothetical protein VNJ50_02670, partial [Gelidibacter sp.]|uniref:hypothetical protein n=1 Tax=Gelidibacter sp. TaxID=2018083 RepID=UPI002C95762C
KINKMLYELSETFQKSIARELAKAPSKQMFHARFQREIYPEISATTIVHKNNKIEIYHYD